MLHAIAIACKSKTAESKHAFSSWPLAVHVSNKIPLSLRCVILPNTGFKITFILKRTRSLQGGRFYNSFLSGVEN